MMGTRQPLQLWGSGRFLLLPLHLKFAFLQVGDLTP